VFLCFFFCFYCEFCFLRSPPLSVFLVPPLRWLKYAKCACCLRTRSCLFFLDDMERKFWRNGGFLDDPSTVFPSADCRRFVRQLPPFPGPVVAAYDLGGSFFR